MKNSLIFLYVLSTFAFTDLYGQSVTPYNCPAVTNGVASLCEGSNNTLYIISGSQIFASNPFSGCTNIQFPNQNYIIWASCFFNGALYVGGNSTLGMNDTTAIYKYANGSWSIAGKLPNAFIRCMTVFNNELYVGGEFQSVNGITSTHIAKYNGNNWASVGGGLGVLFEVRALTVYNNNLYASGRQISNDATVYILSSGNWISIATASNSGNFTIIESMIEFNGDLVIAGMFSHVNGVTSMNISHFNGSVWSAFGSGLTGGAGRVSSLAIYNGNLYAGGSFTDSGGNILNNIAQWNGSIWTDVAGGLPNGIVSTMKNFLGSLICGGSFTIPSTGLVNSLAKISNCNSNLTFTGSNTICLGSTKTLTASAGTFFQWYKNGILQSSGTANSFEATSAGNYICFITTPCGVTVSNAISIIVNALPDANISAGGSTTFCAGGSVQLFVSPGSNNSYQWKKYANNISGATTTSYNASGTGKYKCVVTNSAGCTKNSNVIEVTSNPLPTATITAGGPTTFCAGGSVVLNANTGAGLTYQWKKYANNIGGATNASYTAAVAGKYKCTVTNANGCSKASNAITVTVPCRIAGQLDSEFRLNADVYPNPSKGTFEIKLNNAVSEPYDIIITDVSGRKVNFERRELSDQIIQISRLETGLYFVILSGENEQIVLKAVVKN
jgi:hypothetical protein